MLGIEDGYDWAFSTAAQVLAYVSPRYHKHGFQTLGFLGLGVNYACFVGKKFLMNIYWHCGGKDMKSVMDFSVGTW